MKVTSLPLRCVTSWLSKLLRLAGLCGLAGLALVLAPQSGLAQTGGGAQNPDTIVNIAQVILPEGAIDPNIDNNTDSAFLDRGARLRIDKISQGADGSFDFTLQGSQTNALAVVTNSGQGSSGYLPVAPGSYNLQEDPQSDFGLLEASCSDANGDSLVSGDRDTGFLASLVIDEGEDVVCNFTNQAFADVTLRVALTQGSGVFSYPHTMEAPQPLPNPLDITTSNLQGQASLTSIWPGSYQFEALQKAGFELVTSQCSGLSADALTLPQDSDGNGVIDGDLLGFDLSANASLDCTLSYRAAAPDLRLYKTVVSGPIFLGNESYQLRYRLEINNIGSAQLSLLSVTDDLADLFSLTAAPLQVGLASFEDKPAGFAGTLNQGFDGGTGLKDSSTELIETPGNLAPGEVLAIEFDVLFERLANATYVDNVASASAQGAGSRIEDGSSNPTALEPISVDSARQQFRRLASWFPAFLDADFWQPTARVLSPASPAVAQTLPNDNPNDVTRVYFSPIGQVYDARSGLPLPGAQITMVDSSGSAIDGSVFYTGQQGQLTGNDGKYYFDINVDSPLAPADGGYYLSVTPPAGYLAPSSLRPALPGRLTLPNGEGVYLVSNQLPASLAEQGSAVPAYYLAFDLSDSRMRVIGNHLPLDPVSNNTVNLTKTAEVAQIEAGDLVAWRLQANNLTSASLTNAYLQDTLPAGLIYVEGSAQITIAGTTSTPEVALSGRTLRFEGLDLGANQSLVLRFLTRSSPALKAASLTNQAQFFETSGLALSNLATATVSVTTPPIFGCSDVLGRSFEDKNANGYHDLDEEGLPGVIVYTARGLKITSDRYGRFHVPCAQMPEDERGQNMILKVDERSLPQGCQITTENPRVIRLTAGKLSKVSFGAVCPKTIRVTLCDGVFVTGSTQIQGQWGRHLQTLTDLVQKGPSHVALSHPTVGDPDLARQRLQRLSRYLKAKAQAAGFKAQISARTSPDVSACPAGNYGPAVSLPPAIAPSPLPQIQACSDKDAAGGKPGLSYCQALRQLSIDEYSAYKGRGTRVQDYNAYVGHVEDWKRDYQQSQAQKSAWSKAQSAQVQRALSQRFYQLLEYRSRYIDL